MHFDGFFCQTISDELRFLGLLYLIQDIWVTKNYNWYVQLKYKCSLNKILQCNKNTWSNSLYSKLSEEGAITPTGSI